MAFLRKNDLIPYSEASNLADYFLADYFLTDQCPKFRSFITILLNNRAF